MRAYWGWSQTNLDNLSVDVFGKYCTTFAIKQNKLKDQNVSIFYVSFTASNILFQL